MRVVLITMDSHLASAAQRAARRLAQALPGVTLKATIRAATDEGGDGTRTTQDYMRAASSASRSASATGRVSADRATDTRVRATKPQPMPAR